MSFWYLISTFIHFCGAAFWIGSMLFLPLVILPAIHRHPDRVTLLYRTGMRFRFFGWIALLILFSTGLLNLYFRGMPISWEFFSQSRYGHLLLIKLAVFSLILILSGVHDFVVGKKALEDFTSENEESPSRRRFKLLARWSGRLNLLFALIVAFLGLALARGGI